MSLDEIATESKYISHSGTILACMIIITNSFSTVLSLSLGDYNARKFVFPGLRSLSLL
jgi:hypothetical protein